MIDPIVIDHGLFSLVKQTTSLAVLSEDVDTYAQAITFRLGTVTPIVVGPSSATPPPARQVIVQEIVDGLVLVSGTVTNWALLDDNNQRCLMTGEVAVPMAVVNGNSFTLTEITITSLGELAATGG